MSLHRFAAAALAPSLLFFAIAGARARLQNATAATSKAAQAGANDALPARAVPLGGIGCGTFDIRPDGRFAHATINNNWERPIETMPGCFAAVWARAGTSSVARVLSSAPSYGLPGTPKLSFDGYWPRAVLSLSDRSLPVSVTLRAFSPFVPQDLKNSSLPAAVLVFTIKNEAHAPVEASVAFSWENLLGVGGTVEKGAFSDRTGNTVEPIFRSDGIFGVRMASPEKQVADAPNRLVYNARGTYALLTAPTTPESVVTTAGWNAMNATPEWWDGFARTGTVSGKVGEGVERSLHPAGVVAVKVSLKENEVVELPFAIAWHTPRYYTLSGTEYGHYYEKSFEDAVDVGRYALDNRQTLLALLDEWQDRLLRSSLPSWFSRELMNDSAALATSTVLTRDSGLGGAHPGPYRFAMLETAADGRAVLGEMERRYLAQPILLTWFPDLDDRALTELALRQEPTGAVPRALGDIEHGFTQEESGASVSDPAIAASFAGQVARRFRWTGDQRVLDRFYPAVKHALEYTSTHDADRNGVPEPNPGPVNTRTSPRDRIYWLAACAIGKDLAESMSDRAFSRTCSGWIDRAERVDDADYPDDALVSWAAPALWMAAGAGVTTPGLMQLSARLSALVCRIPRTEISPGVASADIPDSLLASNAPASREGLDAAILAAALTASMRGSSRVDCCLAWLLGAERKAVRPLATSSTSEGATWYVLQGVEGVHLDLPDARLAIAPVLPGKTRVLSAPLFTPTFWGSIDYRLALTSARMTFRLDRIMPALPPRTKGKESTSSSAANPVTLLLKEVELPVRADRVTTEVAASLGRAPLQGKLTHLDDGRLVFTFASPISLAVGQSLSYHLR